jgi:hypothetical protein
MKEYSDLTKFFDPAKLADDTVLALSWIQRGAKVSPELLEDGIKLCEYLIYLFQESNTRKAETEQWSFRVVLDDRKVLQDSVINMDKERRNAEEVCKWIKELINNPTSHTSEIDPSSYEKKSDRSSLSRTMAHAMILKCPVHKWTFKTC